jgi:hypothetical protein
MKNNKKNVIVAISFILATLLSVNAFAAVESTVDGRNVVMVNLDDGSSLVNRSTNSWYLASKYRDNGKNLKETGRDQWSVYLTVDDTDIKVQIDLWKKEVYRIDAQGHRTIYGKVNQSFNAKKTDWNENIFVPSVIISKHSGKCLDVESASIANGARPIQYDCHNLPHQQFKFKHNLDEDGYGLLVAEHSGKCLDVESASIANGASVIQYGCHMAEHQLFRFSANEDGYGMIIAKHSGRCLGIEAASMANIAPLLQLDCNGLPNQLFKIIPVGTSLDMATATGERKLSYTTPTLATKLPYTTLFFANEKDATIFLVKYAEAKHLETAKKHNVTPNVLWTKYHHKSRLVKHLSSIYSEEKIGELGRQYGPEGPAIGIVECNGDGVYRIASGASCPPIPGMGGASIIDEILRCDTNRITNCESAYAAKALRGVFESVSRDGIQSQIIRYFADPDTWLGKEGAFTKAAENYIPGAGFITAIFHSAAGHQERAQSAAITAVVTSATTVAVTLTGGAAGAAVGAVYGAAAGTAAAVSVSVTVGGIGAITESMSQSALRNKTVTTNVLYDGLEGMAGELPGGRGFFGFAAAESVNQLAP